MTDSKLISSSRLQRSRWLALPAALVALGGVLLWWQRTQRHSLPPAEPLPLPSPIEPIESAPVTPVSLPPSSPRTQSPLRWLLYIGSTLLFAGLLITLQNVIPELSVVLFGLLIVGTTVYIARQSYGRLRQAVMGHPAQFLAQGWQNVMPYAEVLSVAAVAIALLCAIWGALALRDVRNYDLLLEQALFLIAIAVGAVGFGIALKPGLPVYAGWRLQGLAAVPKNTFNAMRKVGSLAATSGGIFLLFLLAETNGRLMNSALLQQVHHVVQLLFLVIGGVLVVVGLGGRVRLPVMTRREFWLLAIVVAGAFLLRFAALETNIPRFVDEANFMDAIPRLWSQPYQRILYPFSEVTAFTWVYPILQSGVSNVVGSGLAAMRLPSVLFGTLGVAAVYFLARTLFHDKALALIAAIILASFPAHLHFSRLGLNNIADPLFGTLSIAFLMRGFQSNRRSDFVVAGAMLGLTQYFYEGGRLLFPPLWAVTVLIGWLNTGRKRTHTVHALLGLFTAVLVAAPVYYTLIATHYPLTPRLANESLASSDWGKAFDRLNIGYSGTLKDRLLNPFLAYTTHSDQSWFYGGTESIVILLLMPMLLLGIAHVFWKLRSVGILITVIWVLATTVGNVFLRDSLWIPRYVVVLPALALLIAVGVWATLNLWLPRSVSRKWVYALAAGMTLLLAAGQTVFYFRDQVPTFMKQFQTDEDWGDAFFRMAELPDGTHVHYIMDVPVWNINIVAFVGYYRLNLTIDTQLPTEITPSRIEWLSRRQSVPHAFFINSKKQGVVSYLGQCFRLGAPEYSPLDIPINSQLVLYRATAAPSRSCGFPLAYQLARDDITAILP